jgi:imidazolonepropionase-like amidohydrolase
MVEGGMAPMETIQAATIKAAELLGMEDQLGSIEEGKVADIIAVDGNPLENIEVMGKVVFVMKEGMVYKN